MAVVVLALMATMLAMEPDSKVLDVVSYAWAGLGASLGPAILISLYWRKMTARGALAGVFSGGVTVIVWSQLEGGIFELYSLVPGFGISVLAIVVGSLMDNSERHTSVYEGFDKMTEKLSKLR